MIGTIICCYDTYHGVKVIINDTCETLGAYSVIITVLFYNVTDRSMVFFVPMTKIGKVEKEQG